MARRVWVIGATGMAVVVLASAAGPSDQTAANPAGSLTTTATTSPTTTSTTISIGAGTTNTTEGPQTSTTSTTTTTTISPPSTTTIPAATTSTTTTVAQSTGDFNGDAFDAAVAAATVDRGDISAGVAVMRNGAVLHTAAFGMEDPFASRPATVETRYRIASVSKMFTAVAIMQLVDDGSIALDQPFVDQLDLDGPFNDPRVAAITVRQLMSHMSGFSASRNNFFGHGVDTWQQAAADALVQTLQFDPGTAFQYSNTNYCLLGMLLESVTGQSFETAIRQRVLKPLGITAHLAPTFDSDKGDALHASSPGRNYMETLGPAGGWVTTPVEIAQLASSLRTELNGIHLLDRTTVEAMRAPVPVPVEVPPPDNGWSYGLGLILFGDGSWGHTGTIESTHAVVVNRPDGLTVAVLVSGKFPSNTDDLLAVIDLAVVAASS
ncbi:MAG: serine hydrolase domain-containing protein [Ilumatobacteraceae bacterium]